MMNRPSFMPLKCGTLIMLSMLVISTTWVCSPAQNNTSRTSKTAELARQLLKEHHYSEAVSYLETQLATSEATEWRFPLLLLLIDGYLGVGDLTKAEMTYQAAERLVVKPAHKRALLKKKQDLIQQKLYFSAISLNDSTRHDETVVAYAEAERLSPPVSNSFFETDLRQVLVDLSMETEIPILWDATVQGLVTYEAYEQPLDEVLRAVLFPLGYTYTYQDGAYFVGSVSPNDPAFGLLSNTEVITLSNIDALEATTLLSDYFRPYVKASQNTNMVCITAPPTLIERIRGDLQILDEPPNQILIEVIVTEISRDALREMGLDWSLTGLKENPVWDLSTDHTGIETPSALWNYSEMGVDIGDYTVDLIASLEVLMQSGDAEIRANPRITTLNGRTAEISLTKDQYFIIQTSTSQTYQYNTLQSVSSGIKLEITPYSSVAGEITVYLNPEVGDVVSKASNDLPEINTRAAKTSVRVMDGETFTIGGLSLQQNKNIQNKIPFLGDIPILGYLFRYDRVETRDTEIVIFVTPHIIAG